jgi:hypothetical protein
MGPSGRSRVGMARWTRGLVGLLACCAALALLVGGGTAQGLGSRRSVALGVASASGLASVSAEALSCSSPRACGVLGEEGSTGDPVLERWDGRSWSVQQVLPDGFVLKGVSCPSNGVCFAAGFLGGPLAIVERWTGGSWSVMPTPPLAGAGLDGISCSSPTACLAIGSVGIDNAPLVEGWNGTTWSVLPAPAGWIQIDLVSCPAATGCVSVGLNGVGLVAARWNGAGWLPEQLPASHQDDGFVDDLSCSSRSACIAVGGWETGACAGSDFVEARAWPEHVAKAAADCQGNLSWRLRGSSWSVRSTSPFLSSVSCVSARWCMADGPVLWNGKRWSRLPAPRNMYPYLVSCTAVRACIGVGDKSALRWDGRRWRRIPGLARART